MNEQEGKSSKAEEAADKGAYLHVLMPDCASQGEALVVGRSYRLWAGLTWSDNNQTKFVIDHVDVDVMVTCIRFEINPISQSLPFPPTPGSVAEFQLTPTVAGKFVVTVFLLVKGEPIHKCEIPFEVC